MSRQTSHMARQSKIFSATRQAPDTDARYTVAGQLARDSDGNQIASTALSDKFARVAANIHKVLTKLEAESVDLVYVQVHVADDAGPIGDVIELCRNHFGEAEPAITIVPVDRLNDEGGLIEISAIAYV